MNIIHKNNEVYIHFNSIKKIEKKKILRKIKKCLANINKNR